MKIPTGDLSDVARARIECGEPEEQVRRDLNLPPRDVTPEQDMQERWLPTPAAVRHATALLAAEPAAEMALIPMVQPNKQRGVWRVGQLVETVPGAVFLGVDSDVEPGSAVPRYCVARNAAAAAARHALGDRRGTVGWATVERDGAVCVTEDY